MNESTVKRFLLFISLTSLFSSCELKDKEEEVPSYVHIESISLSTTSAQGSNSHKITDAWIFADNEFIGAFQLPATFPVLKSGTHEIQVLAGIKQNGISATRIEYPLYQPDYETVQLIPGGTTTISPSVTYYPGITFPWLEDFESAGFNVSPSPFGTDTTLQITTDPSEVFEGAKSGVAYLDASHYKFECISSFSVPLPKGGNAIFLELNYKTNNKFIVGIYGNGSSQEAVLQVNPSATWNKIYVNMTDAVRAATSSTSFTVFIGMVKDAGVEKPTLYLDNIKLAHQ
jgi:hypothetical protein